MASTAPTADVAVRRTLLFGTQGRIYGCDIGLVREIVPVRPTTRLPGAPACVLGLINLRGTIVTVLDLAVRLGEREGVRRDGSIIMIEHGTKMVGVAVDDVMDVQMIADDRVQSAADAEGVDGALEAGGIVRGVGRLEDERVVILLELQTIIEQLLL